MKKNKTEKFKIAGGFMEKYFGKRIKHAENNERKLSEGWINIDQDPSAEFEL